ISEKKLLADLIFIRSDLTKDAESVHTCKQDDDDQAAEAGQQGKPRTQYEPVKARSETHSVLCPALFRQRRPYLHSPKANPLTRLNGACTGSFSQKYQLAGIWPQHSERLPSLYDEKPYRSSGNRSAGGFLRGRVRKTSRRSGPGSENVGRHDSGSRQNINGK